MTPRSKRYFERKKRSNLLPAINILLERIREAAKAYSDFYHEVHNRMQSKFDTNKSVAHIDEVVNLNTNT